jgi:geranylgeranyl diphosphate synthase type I
VEEHLRDGEVGAGPALAHEVRDVGVVVGRARVLLGEGRDTHAEVAGGPDQPHELLGVLEPLVVADPVGLRVARRVAPQRQHVAHPGGRERPDDASQLGDAVVDGGEVRQRGEGGVGGDPLGHRQRAVARGATGAVGDRHEVRLQPLELAQGLPQVALAGLGLGGEELERRQRLAARQHVADRRGGHGRQRRRRRRARAAYAPDHEPALTRARSTATTCASACRRPRRLRRRQQPCSTRERGAEPAHRRAGRPLPAASGCARVLLLGLPRRRGRRRDEVVAAAAALELFQACALIHDDVMDGSDTRRGQPAVHRRFASLHRTEAGTGDPEASARGGDPARRPVPVVVGRDAATCGLPAELLRDGHRVFDEMRTELMGGQYLDLLEQARGGGSVERALRVARYKSAKYTIEKPLHLGAVLAGAEQAVLDGYSGYGLPLGEAFQLRDDVLGVFGDPAETGKPAGDDLREGKRTALVALALESASPAQAAAVRRHLGDPHLSEDGVAVLRDVICDTGALTRVEAMVEELMADALTALDATPVDDEAREVLRELASPPPAGASERSYLAGMSTPTLAANDPCWCGSGRKYKRCHRLADLDPERVAQEQAAGARPSGSPRSTCGPGRQSPRRDGAGAHPAPRLRARQARPPEHRDPAAQGRRDDRAHAARRPAAAEVLPRSAPPSARRHHRRARPRSRTRAASPAAATRRR